MMVVRAAMPYQFRMLDN